MAYTHLSPLSDVHILETDEGLTCMNCPFRHAPPWHVIAATPEAMVAHLLAHRAAGDKVPEAAFACAQPTSRGAERV